MVGGLPSVPEISSRSRDGTPRARLGLFALLVGGTFVLITLAGFVFGAVDELLHLSASHSLRTALGIAVALLSIAMFAATRSARLSAPLVSNLGIGYLMMLVFIVAFARFSLPRQADYVSYGVSFTCVLILLFPLVVSTSVGRTVAGAFLAAAMEPLALAVTTSMGHPSPTPISALSMIVPTFVCAGLASIPAVILGRLGRDVDEARHLGSYRLHHRIGAGGMGEVWSAEHELLARPAAIKIIRGGPGLDGETLARFEREAQATALLVSPHTVDLFDFGTTDDGSFYYVMELLDGVDLQSLISRFGPVSSERAAFLLAQICDSLEDAHRSGLIHRDIKPANIFVCRYGHRRDYVKVLDFGLVKESGAKPDPKATGERVARGTPAYMAPEIALGKAIDLRIDLYGVGCIAYWLLTGETVFSGNTATEIALKHVQEPVVPPSRRTELAIDPRLEEIVMACLAKDPDDRPATAESIRKALERMGLEDAWTEERSEAWWRRHLPEGTTTASFDGKPVRLMPTARRSAAAGRARHRHGPRPGGAGTAQSGG